MCLHEIQKSRVDVSKDAVGEFLPCLGESLGADLAKHVRLVRQRREERVELVLDTSLEAGQHHHDQNGKRQNPYTSECVRFETKCFAKFICFQIVN